MFTYLKPFIVTVVCFIDYSVINHSSMVSLVTEVPSWFSHPDNDLFINAKPFVFGVPLPTQAVCITF